MLFRSITAMLTGISHDPTVTNCLEMVDSLLASIAVRCEHEIGWMVSEVDEIREVAHQLISAGHDDGQVAAALALLDENRPTSYDTEAVRARYHAASAVFADCVELVPTSDTPLQQKITTLVDSRLDHEREIRGAVALVGRG